MAAVDFLHHENLSTWAGVEPATLGAEGQRQTNHGTKPAFLVLLIPKRNRDARASHLSRDLYEEHRSWSFNGDCFQKTMRECCLLEDIYFVCVPLSFENRKAHLKWYRNHRDWSMDQ
ncbi:hypothetical protein TNCV_564691 [Trichonephila clavipes]|nr:hypothetical protein TNCV_564691 [Trichonephila clavipes]